MDQRRRQALRPRRPAHRRFQIVGLFTCDRLYALDPVNIPYLRRKVASVVARAGYSADSHSGRALANVLETYPRDELFQIDEDTLFHFALIIVQLNERPRVRVLPRSTLRALRLRPRLRAARALTAAGRAPPSAGCWRPRSTAKSRRLPLLSRKARWSACISSSCAARRARPSDRAAARIRRVAHHEDVAGFSARGACRCSRSGRSPAIFFARYRRTRFRRPIATRFRPRPRSRTSPPSSSMSADAPLGVDFQRGAGGDGKRGAA